MITCSNIYAQNNIFDQQKDKNFKPTFFIGSGLYTLNGDIKNDNTGILKGTSGFNAGIKFDINKDLLFLNNMDLSFLILRNSFSANNQIDKFSSEVNGFGLHLGYTPNWELKFLKLRPIFSLGFEQYTSNTIVNDIKQERSSMFSITDHIGFRMHLSDRLQFDLTFRTGMVLGDIDMYDGGGNDKFRAINFTLHYDLFSVISAVENTIDNSYYDDVNFEKLEAEDEDSDLVLDIDDYCLGTPLGVKVDNNGCPLDDDKDGIPNYLDQQKNTPQGSIVDVNGVRLSSEKYQSIYSDYEAATRKYANFYNELEINREDYKTVDEYLIARANAFNRAYNESINNDVSVKGLIYKVKIGEYQQGIPPKIQNRLLSFDDLESYTMVNGIVLYSVGEFGSVEEAIQKQNILDEQGYLDTEILVDNNGEVSTYVPFVPENNIDETEEITLFDNKQDTISESDNEELETISTSIYRIQIGAFKTPLPDAVFKGVDNLLSFTGKDGYIRYMAGSFENYEDAVDYQLQMRARGFSDAFIVIFKDGKRIGLNIAIKENKNKSVNNPKKEIKKNLIDLKYTVQIMVVEGESLSAENIKMIAQLGKIDKTATGSDMYEYYAGTYTSLEEANKQLEKARKIGFLDAFIFATNNNERISLENAKILLKQQSLK